MTTATQTTTIPASFYDGRVHVWPFHIGADFIAKRDALAADGFTYRFGGDSFECVKEMR